MSWLAEKDFKVRGHRSRP